jgi:hypothetical protein
MVYDTQQELRETEADDGNHMVNKKKKEKKEKPNFFSVEVPKCGDDDQNRKGKTVEDNFKLFLFIFIYLKSHSAIGGRGKKYIIIKRKIERKKYLRKQNQKGKCLYTPPIRSPGLCPYTGWRRFFGKSLVVVVVVV